MAYTKIHAVKAAVNKAVDHIYIPTKIDESILIFSYVCGSETVAYDFRSYKESQAGKNGFAWKERLKSTIDETIKTPKLTNIPKHTLAQNLQNFHCYFSFI